MRSRLWLVLSLLLVLLAPNVAYANDLVDGALSGWSNGIGIWQNEREQPEVETVEEEDSVFELSFRAANPVTSAIQSVASSFTRLKIGSDNVTLMQFIRYTIMGRTSNSSSPAAWSILPKVLALIFMWWGLRKVVYMIFRSFRKGKINA